MGNKNLNEGTTSSFLKNLQEAIDSGDLSKGKDEIEKINKIHKLAEYKISDGMDVKIAEAIIEKRIEETGEKDALSVEDRELISLESEKEKVRLEKEEAKLKLIAQIENAENEIEQIRKELEEVKNQYNAVIHAQEEEVKILKIKYEARFGEGNDE
jgi:hypothetical protein